MITFNTDHTNLIIECDDDDEPSLEDILVAFANSIDVDFIRLENEGAPVFLGNDYAEYQVIALINGTPHRFGIGPKERWTLLAYNRVVIPSYQD